MGDVPRAQQSLHRLDDLEPAVFLQGQHQPLHLQDGGHEAKQYPTHHQGVADPRRRLPRFRNVQDNPVNVPFGDAFVDVADLDLKIGGVRDNPFDVPHRFGQDRFVGLVGDHPAGVADRTEQRGSQRPGAQAPFNHRGAGEYIGEIDDIAQVFGVDDLGAPGHLPHEIAQGGAHRQQDVAFVGAVPSADAAPDQLVVKQPPQVTVVGLPLSQGDHVAAGLAVDQQGQVAGLEIVLVGLSLVQI